MKSGFLVRAAALAFPLVSAAAQPAAHAAPPTATAIVDSFKGISALFAARLATAFDSIPASRFGYAPTPAQQTVGYVAQHLVDANYVLCGRFSGMRRPMRAKDALADTVKARWPKDTLVAQLKASFAFCAEAVSGLDDAGLAVQMPAGPSNEGQTSQRARDLLLFATDLAEHYAQIASYMRAMGLVPPSALTAAPRTPIDLAAAVLARYEGSYEVPASAQFGSPALHLDVSLRNGTLFLKPAGQPEARLLPYTETDFFFREISATITFTRGSAGAVTGLVLHNNGEDRVGRKIGR